MTPDIRKHLDTLNIKQPAALELVDETRLAIGQVAMANPVGDLAAELLAGDLSAKQAAAKVVEASRLLVVREKSREVMRDLEGTFDKMTRTALRDNADTLIEAMRPAFDTACATVVASTELLGEDPDGTQVGNLGPAAAVAYKHRQDAVTHLGAIRRIRVALEQVGYGSGTICNYVAAIPDAPALEQATQQYHGRGEGIARLAAAGYEMRLNLATEASQVAEGARLATEAHTQALLAEAKAANLKATARYVADWVALAPKAPVS